MVYERYGLRLCTRLFPGLRREIGIKSGKFILFQFLRHIGIDVQRSRNVCVSQSILNHLDIDTGFTHSGGERMTQRMAAEMRQQHFCTRILVQFRIITVPYDSADRLIQRPKCWAPPYLLIKIKSE